MARARTMKQSKACCVSRLIADSAAGLAACSSSTITPTSQCTMITHKHQLSLCALDRLDSQQEKWKGKKKPNRGPLTTLALNIDETIAEGAP